MQEKKQTIAKKVLLKLADHLKVKGIQGVADYLGEDKNKLYAWSKRGKIADTGTILDKCPYLNIEWLKTGEGNMFKEGKPEQNPYRIKEEKVLTVNEKPTSDNPTRVVRDTAVDMLEWLANNHPADFYELLTLIRASYIRRRDGNS